MNKTAMPMPGVGGNTGGIKPIPNLTPSVPMAPALPLGKPAAPIAKGPASPQLKSAAWGLGYLFSYRFPKAEAFQKVAKALNTNERAIRILFAKQAMAPLLKQAMNPMGLGALAFLAGTVGKPMARAGENYLYNRMGGYGLMGGPHAGMFGGLDPKAESDFHRMMLRESIKRQQRMNEFQEMNMAMTGYPMTTPYQATRMVPGAGY